MGGPISGYQAKPELQNYLFITKIANAKPLYESEKYL